MNRIPKRTEASAPSTVGPVSVVAIKSHLGLFSGSGTPIADPAMDGDLGDYLEYAAELTSDFLGRPVAPFEVVDYYDTVAQNDVVIPSFRGSLISPVLQCYQADDYRLIDLHTFPDPTTDPTRYMVTSIVPDLATDYTYPVRFSYTAPAFDERGYSLVTGTIIDIVRLRWDSRGQPPNTATTKAIQDMMDMSLRTLRGGV